MPNVAFATYRTSPNMTNDDRLAAKILRESGVSVSSAAWDSTDIDWSRFDCVIIRSTWNYHLKPNDYANWIWGFGSTAGRLWNPPEAVVENMNKRYLTVLADIGVNVVPTIYQTAAEDLRLRTVLERWGWDEVVIKPAVSASARGTWRTCVAAAELDQTKFAAQVQAEDILLQPYLPEIATKGEWSLVFFGGVYSHAVLKRPAAGDFRVQREFGGNSTAEDPDPALIYQARSILSVVDHPLLYARVDGIERDGRFVLMELEINEPDLFLRFADGAAQRFAEAIMQVLSSGEVPA
jgi:glutathione synthase/RimK-type ligase-like ATP-grasp enzyme